MPETKITEQEFFKSLARLEALAKGESGDMNKSQICTGGNSEPSSWAGTNKQSVPQQGEGCGADQDGDYDAGKARKSIAEKVLKGQPLSADDVAFLNKSQDQDEDDRGGDKDPREDKDDDKKDDDKDEKGGDKGPLAAMFGKSQDMGKSFAQAVSENDTLQKGIEVSDFLLEMTKSFALGLENVKRELRAEMRGLVGQMASEQGDFNKSLAEAVANIGYGVGALSKGIEEQANQPVGAPKSQLRAVQGGQGVQPLQKGGSPLEGVTKAQVLDTMTGMLEKGMCSPLDVVKFETTGDLNPAIRDQIVKSLAGNQ